ncbi:MAG: heavy metal-associated domain-containing protein, partial [Aquaticitalea sp.]
MKHTYHINGMTCDGCRSHVEKTLSEVKGVSKASVNLEKAEATIEMEKHIPIETFQEALKKDGGTYSIELPNKSEKGAMKHTYHIHGMTCNGCRSHVENILSKVEGVINAKVDLEKEEAIIETNGHFP